MLNPEIASNFSESNAKQALDIIMQYPELIDVINQYLPTIAKQLADGFNLNPLTLPRFQALNLSEKALFLTKFLATRAEIAYKQQALRWESELKEDLNNILAIDFNDIDLSNMDYNEISTLTGSIHGKIDSYNQAKESRRYEFNTLSNELDGSDDSPPQAPSLAPATSSYAFYLKMAAATATQQEQRRKELQEQKQLFELAFAKWNDLIYKNRRLLERCEEKQAALRPRRAYAYR
ncbi:hypothetical protein [Candidatus Berkiella aquae]|uniref:Uncharacterized protein n=1 Tax=Candidatus Berkiella aquae TaxID=295108 RepID=A0A0Q9YW26_9GAMM|nr:hypothetical protein [Candidatus Berkiella aquae]MCS5711293.1 hypothetical protein [Candidatus Berkiella aquae]